MTHSSEKDIAAVTEDVRLGHLDKLSQILDTAFVIPGTRFRIGLDGIMGLIPGVGDATGAALSTYLIFEAARLGLPITGLMRMLGNVAIETVFGAIPVVGDIFDIGWKANVRNLALLRAYADEFRLQGRSLGQILRLFLVPIILIVLGLIALAIFALQFVYRLIIS